MSRYTKVNRIVSVSSSAAAVIGVTGCYVILRKSRGCALYFMENVDGKPAMNICREFKSLSHAKRYVKEYCNVDSSSFSG